MNGVKKEYIQMTEFILWYLVFSMSAVGTGKLYMYLIQPNQLFAFMQPVISEAKFINNFLYRSIGGCEICTIQRFNDFAYIVLLSITDSILPDSSLVIVITAYIILYIMFAGLSYFMYSLIQVRNIQHPKTEKTTLHV